MIATLALLMTVVIGSSVLVMLASGDRYNAQKSGQSFFVMKNDEETMRAMAERYDALFTEPVDAIESNEDELKPAEVDFDEFRQRIEASNEAIDGFEIEAIMRVTYDRDSQQHRARRFPFAYQEMRFAYVKPYYVVRQKVEYEGMTEPAWRVTLYFDHKRILISPNIVMENAQPRYVRNYHINNSTWQIQLNEPGILMFGRGIGLWWQEFEKRNSKFQNLKFIWSPSCRFYRDDAHPNLTIYDDLNSNGGVITDSIDSPFYAEPTSRYWLNADKGYTWSRFSKTIHYPQGVYFGPRGETPSTQLIPGGEPNEQYRAEAFDYRETDGVWLPWRLRITQPAETQDYALTAARRIGDAQAYKQEIENLLKPGPDDTVTDMTLIQPGARIAQ